MALTSGTAGSTRNVLPAARTGWGLRVERLSKTFPGTRALREVSFEVAAGTVHALLGGNGSGKSTLIKILAGVHTGDPGGAVQVDDERCASHQVSPEWARRAGLSFVHQDLGLFDPLTVAENLYSGRPYPRRLGRIDWRAMRRSAAEVLERLEIPVAPDSPVRDLRPAERTLVAIARALRGREERSGGLLVLDEPTARLPKAEVDQLLGALRRYAADGQTILYVSHRLGEVLEVADTTTVLRDGVAVETRPVPGLDENELGRLIVGRELATAPARRAATVSAGRPLLEVDGLRGGPLRGVDLRLYRGEVVGAAGLVGSGRTSLLEMLFGTRGRTAGRVLLDGAVVPPADVPTAVSLGMAYIPEERGVAAFGDLSVTENLSAADPARYRARGWFHHGREHRDAVESVARFQVRAPSVAAPLSVLSGGNQQKVIVARWLRCSPRLLLLDEPTQGVDVGARADIHRQIEAAVGSGMAVLLVSSDIDELLRLSDRVFVLAGGVITAEARAADCSRDWLIDRVYSPTTTGARS